MSNEESERITTSQDVISRLHDKIDEQQARIAELEGQLEAIGAGGVEPLRKQAPQGMEQDAARWRMAALISRETIVHPDKRTAPEAVAAYMHAVHSGLDIQGAIDAALAAQAKQGGA